MNDPIDRAAASFREAITRAIVPLQTTRVVSSDAFTRLEKAAEELVALLKGHELVSKSLLLEFYGTARLLRNEAPYFGSERSRIESVALNLEKYLSLILGDEGPHDRKPGVPRIM